VEWVVPGGTRLDWMGRAGESPENAGEGFLQQGTTLEDAGRAEGGQGGHISHCGTGRLDNIEPRANAQHQQASP